MNFLCRLGTGADTEQLVLFIACGRSSAFLRIQHPDNFAPVGVNPRFSTENEWYSPPNKPESPNVDTLRESDRSYKISSINPTKRIALAGHRP